MGGTFVTMMAGAIVDGWRQAVGSTPPASAVQDLVSRYVDLVYGQNVRPELAQRFLNCAEAAGSGEDAVDITFASGEFDALSYACFRLLFERLDREAERHAFTVDVGARFFGRLERHLGLEPPDQLADPSDLKQLEASLALLGDFLVRQGYLREHFVFHFDVRIASERHRIDQRAVDFVPTLLRGETGYALYEMGFPAILPSAVYLYQTMGEAQHHSSRTIEELFAQAGCRARETEDFDPSDFPSDRVVELWEIRRK